MLIKYVRNGEGNRVGVVVATGASKVGWSLCNKKDKWDRKKGLMIASNRAERGFHSVIPTMYVKEHDCETGKVIQREVMVSAFNHMEERALSYYKEV